MPQVVVIAGPNGAGKTTVSRTLLSEILHSKAFVNADAIAQGLNGLAPETQAFQAGRLMLQKLDEFAEAGEDFAVERVRIRIQTGGHSIPEPTIRSRYVRSWDNFLRLYQPIADEWRVVDNSHDTGYQLIATGSQATVTTVLNPQTWAQFSQGPKP